MSDSPTDRAVTRNDVASRAGVSPAVVSYVVNDGPRPVKQSTRERVLEAIRDLGYRPNAVARSLKIKSTRALGLIVPDNSNPFFAELARVVEDAAFTAGYTLLLANARGDGEREAAHVQTFLAHQVDGILLISSGHSEALLGTLEHESTPVVLVDRSLPTASAATLEVDNEGGGFVATRHLLEHGHERIACLAGPTDLSPSADRHRGWLSAMRQSGLSTGPGLLARSAFDRHAAYPVAQRLLSERDRPTAIFAATDQQAIAVLRVAADLGLRVPDDLAVIGFDGILEGAFTVPRLATVRQPVTQIGRKAVDLLLDRDRPNEHHVLPVVLTPNESCGCPTRHAARRRPHLSEAG